MRLFFQFGALLLLFSLTAAAVCYAPDGTTVLRQDTPCSSEEGASCCGKNSACLSNGLCKQTEYSSHPSDLIYGRGSCTDPSWESPSCVKSCMDPSAADSMQSGEGVRKCDGEFEGFERYYCVNGRTHQLDTNVICANASYYFQFPGTPTTMTIIGVNTSIPAATAASINLFTTTTSSFTTTTSSSATAISPSNILTSVTSATSATTNTANTTLLNTGPNPNSLPQSPSRNDNSVAMGAGIGVPAGALAIGLIVFLLLRRRRHSRAQPQTKDELRYELASPDHPRCAELKGEYVAAQLSSQASPVEAPSEGVYYGSRRPMDGRLYVPSNLSRDVSQELSRMTTPLAVEDRV